MKKELLFDLPSPYRANFQIFAYRFGSGAPAAAIVGAMRGDEVQQQFIASQLVKHLMAIEAAGGIVPGQEILVIPSANGYSMNSQNRFWALDGTDINRMFPGYDKGETTQRIAAALFAALKGYRYGVQLASFYLHGDFIPHVRVIETGYEDVDSARDFGLPYVLVREPSAFDTALLNYNWQIFGTHAYAVYSGETDTLNPDSAQVAWHAILRFLAQHGCVTHTPVAECSGAGSESVVIREHALPVVISDRGGILYPAVHAGDTVHRGDLLAHILDPYDGSVRSEVTAPVSGKIFYAYQGPLISQHTLIYRLVSS